ncbi:MAG: nodulation protein NfeD [Nitrososphaerota archaeon]|nr:nodulation protein NfeD [Nitrososphaerota archaeon]
MFFSQAHTIVVASSATSKEVVVVNLDVPIDQGSSNLVSRAVDRAQTDNAVAVIIDMNTPGGLLQDMLSIVDSISNATAQGIPVYTYVGNNSLAASAGSYIAMATKEIFMGPGSQIGPSTPIVEGGTALEQNHTESGMLSLMVSLAQANGRNQTAVTLMVLDDVAYSYSAALTYHVADHSSNSLTQTLSLLGLSSDNVVTISENPTEQLLSFLSNPTVDGIILLIGIIAIALDFLHPTFILSIAGAILIALGLIGAEAIQSGGNASALAVPFVLFVAAAALIVLEVKTGHGFMLFAGVVVGALATILIAYEVPYSPSPFGDLQYLELGVFVVIGGFLAAYARWIGRSLHSRPFVGSETLLGKTGTVFADLSPAGEVSIDGIIWKAKSSNSQPVSTGTRVRVVRRYNLVLEVEPEPIKENIQSSS